MKIDYPDKEEDLTEEICVNCEWHSVCEQQDPEKFRCIQIWKKKQ